MKTAFFTICSRNYLAYALTLQQSLRIHEPDAPFFVYLADEPLETADAPDAAIIPIGDLGLPDLLDMAFRYTVMEFNTAIKADCFLDLLAKRGFDAAVYIDPDIQVFAPLVEVHNALSGGASAVVTPHLLGPLPAGAIPGELDILKSGVFNLGFAAFARTDESLAFISWWASKLHTDCYSAPERGLFVDQRFVDFAPAYIDRLSILRHPGYNVAYWNTARRRVSEEGDQFFADGLPLVFFHFSGVVPGNSEVFSKHLGGAPVDVSAVVMSLVRQYLSELERNQHSRWSSVPYAYGRFRDGSPILPPMRRRPPETGGPEDWFAAPDLVYWTAPDPRVAQKRGRRITRLMMGIWDMRPDLQAAYPLLTEESRRKFHFWFLVHGSAEYEINGTGDANTVVSGLIRARAYLRR